MSTFVHERPFSRSARPPKTAVGARSFLRKAPFSAPAASSAEAGSRPVQTQAALGSQPASRSREAKKGLARTCGSVRRRRLRGLGAVNRSYGPGRCSNRRGHCPRPVRPRPSLPGHNRVRARVGARCRRFREPAWRRRRARMRWAAAATGVGGAHLFLKYTPQVGGARTLGSRRRTWAPTASPLRGSQEPL